MQRYTNQVRVNSGSPPPVVDLGAPVSTPTITVFISGTADLATLFSDNLATPTPLANPFLGTSTVPGPGGFFFFYADDGRYDVQVSLGTPAIPLPYIIAGDVLLNQFALVVNAVEDCGADPTGLTDTTVALQCALDLGQTEGRAVRFPGGTYRTSAPLNVHSFTHLFGDGWNVTFLRPMLVSYADHMIQYLSGSDDLVECTISDLQINGDFSGTRSADNGILLQRAQACVVERVFVFRVLGDGVETTNPAAGRSSWIRFNHIRQVTGTGLNIESTDPYIFQNHIADCGGDGILAVRIGAKITMNHVGRSGAAPLADIHVQGVGANILGNLCEEGVSQGIFYDATGLTAVGMISGNRIHTKLAVGQWGIHVQGTRVSILGNRLSNVADGVFYEDGTLGSYIDNNVSGAPAIVTLAAGTVPSPLNLGNVLDLSSKNAYPLRRIWIPARDFEPIAAGATFGIQGSNGLYSAYSFLNGADEGIAAQTPLPLDWDDGVLVFILHHTNLGAGAGNVVWRTRAMARGTTSNLNLAATDIASDTIAAPAQNILTISTTTLVHSGNASNYLIRTSVERLGTSGSDTLGNPAGLLGLEIQYIPGM